MNPISILIADDHAIVRTGLKSLLGTQPGFEVVAEAEDGDEAIRLAQLHQPTVIVMDYMMPRKDGAAAAAEILSAHPDTRILMLTSYGAATGIAQAIRAGAAGALIKSGNNEELITAIKTIASGNSYIPPEIKRTLAENPQKETLTDRQLTILELIIRGFSNLDIAKNLGIREDSVKKHTYAIYAKIGAASRTEAVAIALRKHLLRGADS